MSHDQKELNEFCENLTSTFNKLIYNYRKGDIYISETNYNKTDDFLTSLQEQLIKDPTLISQICILITQDNDYLDIEEEIHGNIKCLIKYQSPSNIRFLPKTEIGQYLLDKPEIAVYNVHDFHTQSKKQREIITTMDNGEYNYSCKTHMRNYLGDDSTFCLTVHVDLTTIKFQDGIGMWTRDYYGINPLSEFQVLIGTQAFSKS